MLNRGSFISDRYEVLDKVGTGGMSDVYKARDHILGRDVAIKVLKQEFADDVNFVAKFRTEAQSAAKLECPNIVNIYDVGNHEGTYFIVMEYVEGITLKTYIEKKGQLFYKECMSIAMQVSRGIQAAHNKGIIHRDIKPQNIMISKEGQVKVTDFGIARASSINTIHADVMGSVHYASPEQARNGFVDAKSDIYSLGIVMYEMITGRLPFDGETAVAVALQHLQEDMVSPAVYVPDLPISLEKIILKCTMKSPERRYSSIDELLSDLRKALVNPDVDFVVMIDNPAVEHTRVMSAEEQEQIRAELLASRAAASVMVNDDDDYDDDYDEDEDDVNSEINPKLDKAITIMSIAAGIIIVAIVVFMLTQIIGLKFGTSEEEETEDNTIQTEETVDITMIDVIGMSESSAISALKSAGISYGLTYASSDDVEEGYVCEQSIESGTVVGKNDTVTITISSGPGTVEIPDVRGMTRTTAVSTLEELEFVVSITYEYSSSYAEDVVISQSPVGSMATKGDTINLVVCAGLASVQVPDLTGITQEEAQAVLEAAGLKLGNVTTEYSDNVEEGLVISQDVVTGKTVDSGTSVSIVISQGAKPTYYSYTGSVSNTYGVTITVTLYDENGTVIDAWDVEDGQAINIAASNISTATGSLEISGEDIETETKTVSFTLQ